MKNMKWEMLVLVLGIVFLGVIPAWAGTITVDDSGGADYTTIQAAINAASPGDTIQVAAGTYNETLNVNKSITITGAGESQVTIDVSGLAGLNNAGIYVSADDVSLHGFTFEGGKSAGTHPRYGVKFGEVSGGSINNVVVENTYRSGFDLLGTSDTTVSNVVSQNNGGHGIALTDCHNITVSNLTTSGNGWQAVSVATWGHYSPLGTHGIVFEGTLNLGGVFQLEQGRYPSGPPETITFSTDPTAGADVTVPAGSFSYALFGDDDEAPSYQRAYFFKTFDEAALAAAYPVQLGHILTTGRYIQSITDPTQLYASTGCSIQAAVDAASTGYTVNVLPGTYTEQVFIGKNMALVGNIGASIASPGSTTVTIPEAASQFDPIIFVYGGTMDASHAVSGTEVVSADVKNLDVNGQNSAPASSTEFVGILLRNVNGEISGNTIHDMFGADGEGNGPQTFGILVYGDSTVQILNNMISDFSRGGISINGDAGAAPDPIAHVAGNTVTGNGLETGTGWWAENGIQIGYGASGEIVGNTVTDCWVNNPSWTATGILVVDTNNVVVADNTVNNNQTGISVTDFPGAFYGSPWDASAVSNVTVKGNSLDGNAWALDVANDVSNLKVLFNKFTNTLFDAIDVYDYGIWYPGYGIPAPSNVVIHYNSITGSGGDGLWVSDSVLSPVDATLNWWGAASGPSGEGTGTGDSVSTNAIFSPWLGTAPDGDPTAPGVQITGPMLIIVAPVGPAPAAGYLNAAIAGANSPDLPYTDTIEVKHGTYDASTPITQPVKIVSEPGSALHTTLNGNMSINGNNVTIGLPLQGFRINGNLTVGAGANAATSKINWCDFYGNMTNNGAGTFDAQYNYWGTQLASVIDGRTTGDIDYEPFLPKNADDSYTDIQALLAAGAASGIDPAIDQLWLMVRLGQDVNTFIQYQNVAGAGALRTPVPGGEINFGGAAGGGGAVEGTISGTYAIGTPITGRFTITDPVTGKPITDAAVTTSLLGPDGELVFWGCASYDETTGEYVFSVDTSGLTPGTYKLIIQTDDGQSKTVSIKIQGA